MLWEPTGKTHDTRELSVWHVVNVQQMQALVMMRVRMVVTGIIVKDLLCEVFPSSSGRVSISSSGPPVESTTKSSGLLSLSLPLAREFLEGRDWVSVMSESVYTSVYQTP